MKNQAPWTLGVAVVLAVAGGCRTVAPPTAEERRSLAMMAIASWAENPRLLAGKLIDEYGAPDRIQTSRLIWNDKYLLKRLVVWDELPNADLEPGVYILEQTVSYPVPPEARADLAAFSDSIRVSPDGTELTALSDGEGNGFLALNLAYEVVKGIKSPEQARHAYQRTRHLALAGKSSAFTQGLLFLPRPLP